LKNSSISLNIKDMSDTICIKNARIFTGIMTIPEGAVIIKNDKIEDVVGKERFRKLILPKNTQYIDLKGDNLCAGFIDTHIHGFGGFDTSDGKVESYLEISKQLVPYGVTTFCPTIYTQKEEYHMAAIEAGVNAMGNEMGAHIEGLHLEGPFISRHQTGAQEESALQEVNMELMHKYAEIGNGCISIMTVAPELKNMRELAIYCIKKGIKLAAGHTNATYENMLEGMQAGILHSTHFFNAMRKLHHRDPGCVGAILIHPEISCEIIADGYHVHPALIKLLYRDKPVDKIVLVTDALGPTMQKKGPMTANKEKVYIKNNIFIKEKDNVIAGSCLTMLKGIKNLISWGITQEDAILFATANPARILGIDRKKGLLIPGFKADITAFNNEYETSLTIIKGRILYEKHKHNV
jgi:N-acetylglucosamine-6-phosphate deacetylase